MSPTRTDWPQPYGAHSTSMALRWSASNVQPTKSRRLHPFSTDRSSTRLLNNKSRSHRRTSPMSLPALDDIVTPTEEPGLWLAYDRLLPDTKIYTRTVSNAEARTVDYHCAWDQGAHLWMIYVMRVLDAQVVLNKPGSVVLWTNCRHPFYDKNPYPDAAPAERTGWVGDFWDLFGAGHGI